MCLQYIPVCMFIHIKVYLSTRQCYNVLGGEHKEYWEDVITSFMDKKQLKASVTHLCTSVQLNLLCPSIID